MNKMFLLCTAVILFTAITISSCSPNAAANENPTLQIEFEDPNLSKGILPDSLQLTTHHYSVSGRGEEGGEFGPLSSIESTLTVSDLQRGDWVLEAQALNSENKVLSQGSKEVTVGNGENNVQIVLDEIPGNGTLRVTFSWDPDGIELNGLNLDVKIKDEEGNERTLNPVTTRMYLGESGISTSLKAGSYVMTAILSNNSGTIIGATEGIRIIDSTVTSGTVEFETLNLTDSGLTIEDDTGRPIVGYIDYTPTSAAPGGIVSMEFVPVSLPTGVTQSDLIFQWYRNGVALIGKTLYTCQVFPQAGVQRYDVIVKTSSSGSIGSANVTLSVH